MYASVVLTLTYFVLTNVVLVEAKVQVLIFGKDNASIMFILQSTGSENKALNVFKVVTFPNDGCNTTTSNDKRGEAFIEL